MSPVVGTAFPGRSRVPHYFDDAPPQRSCDLVASTFLLPIFAAPLLPLGFLDVQFVETFAPAAIDDVLRCHSRTYRPRVLETPFQFVAAVATHRFEATHGLAT